MFVFIDESGDTSFSQLTQSFNFTLAITWPTASAAKACHCSKQDVKPIMKKLEKLGAFKMLQTGKSGQHSNRAALYRREV